MPIAYTVNVEDDLLVITASGKDDDEDEVKQYGMAVILAAIEHHCRRVLCDERNLEYALDTFSTYEAATFIAEAAPKVSAVAIVCRAQDAETAAFWETVVVNRGLRARMFTDIGQARQWLAENPA